MIEILNLLDELFNNLGKTRTSKSGGLYSKRKCYNFLIEESGKLLKKGSATDENLAKFLYNFALFIEGTKAVKMVNNLFIEIKNKLRLEMNNYSNFEEFCVYLAKYEFN